MTSTKRDNQKRVADGTAANRRLIACQRCVWRHTFKKTRRGIFNEIRLRGPPLQCNYAHCDFQFFENDEEVQKITKKSIKMQIRESLLPAIEREN